MSRRPAPRFAVLLATSLFVVMGCTRGDEAPRRLVNGAPAGRPPIELEGVDLPAVLGITRVVAAARADPGSRVGSCLRQGWGERPWGPAVHRIGALGESVTVGNRSGSGLYACDDSAGPREGNEPWCGFAFGRLADGMLLDPRLDLGGCATNRGRLVAFAWLTPGRRTHFVVVRHRAFAEAYEVVARLPVRVATAEGIDAIGSSATVSLSEHGADGRLLRAYELEARVAG